MPSTRALRLAAATSSNCVLACNTGMCWSRAIFPIPTRPTRSRRIYPSPVLVLFILSKAGQPESVRKSVWTYAQHAPGRARRPCAKWATSRPPEGISLGMTRFHQTPAFILGDWGTSRLRLYLCDAANNVLETREARGAAAARGEHEQVLDTETAAWHADAGPLPVVLCGMVGSSIGWVQAPYLAAPADPQRLATASLSLRGGAVRIVPGVSCRNRLGAPDVMRGEETQILGALSLEPALRRGAHLVCLPGTHTKWVVVRDGAIVEFLTAPAGEL